MTPAKSDAPNMPIFAWFTRAGSSKAIPETKIATVNPIPARNATPSTCLQVTPEGSRPMPSRTASHVMPNTPMALPANSATAMPRVTRLRESLRQGIRREDDAGIGEGEYWQDDKADPGMNDPFKTFQRSLGTAAEFFDLLRYSLCLLFVTVRHSFSEVVKQFFYGSGVVLALEIRLGRYNGRQQDSSQSGMNSGTRGRTATLQSSGRDRNPGT